MKKGLFLIVALTIMITSCKKAETTTAENPFMTEWGTEFNVPAFNKIYAKHYAMAFDEGMKQQLAEIDSIANNAEAATFENTIEALENSGAILNRVAGVFFNMTESNTNDTIANLEIEYSPILSAHSDKMYMNENLWTRVKSIYDNQASMNLNKEQQMLLKKYYDNFVNGGADLSGDAKTRFSEINKELSVLSVQFGQNALNSTNSYKLVVDKKEDLAGLPQGVVDAAAETAKENGMEGKWVFTLQNSSVMPFLQYADNRDLRKEIFTAYLNRGNNGDSLDNKNIISKIVSLRTEKAQLMGYKNSSEYVLQRCMAQNPANVYDLLMKVYNPALKIAKKEAKEMQDYIDKQGGNFKLESHDWRYYAEKIRKEKYNFDENELKPYLTLDNVLNGFFTTANKLWGITFTKLDGMPTYHQDATIYECKDANGSSLAIFYLDFHPRASKRGGAWMSNFSEQRMVEGKDQRPVITIVCNFTKPTATEPSLLTFDEASTLFHEFGHGIHGMFSKCQYAATAGTNVPRDFVELPSQIMENWISDPEVLKSFAKHYKTGEVIPDELIKKLDAASKYGQGFATTELAAAALLDMDYHTVNSTNPVDVAAFEAEAANKIGLIAEIPQRYRSTYFSHIFSGGYFSGYYSYLWAEVLDADAFAFFKQKGIFDKETAESFRRNVLEKGGSDEAMILYENFRGQKPTTEPMLVKRGLI